jgi:2-oxoglutarate dehydrogenase E1 component
MNPAQSSPRAIPPSVNALSPEFLEAEYARFRADPNALAPDLKAFFLGFDLGMTTSGGATGATTGGAARSDSSRSAADLIAQYRAQGHLAAAIDPFGRARQRPASLALASHGISDADLSRVVSVEMGGASRSLPLRDVVAAMEAAYCGPLGVEFVHAATDAERTWWIQRIEAPANPPAGAMRVAALNLMLEAETFEEFLAKRYQSAKRFSLEGGESLVALLHQLIESFGAAGAKELVMAMAHRGRLNVLKTILKKELERFFSEFEDAKFDDHTNDGDVKYHRGYSGDYALASGGTVHLSLMNNPSHLESVNPIAMGRCRSRQDMLDAGDRSKRVPVLIHGDAAVAGQGVVAECLNMAGLEGYAVGGTVHVVINNLVGFTTDPSDARSTTYCTDVAKMIAAPVLHVNGMDPDAVLRAARLAAEYRDAFRKDVFIDLVCYRRYGHNEQDEPSYTQPIETRLVNQAKATPPARRYAATLIAQGVTTQDAVDAFVAREIATLDEVQTRTKAKPVYPVPPPAQGLWAGFTGEYTFDSPDTSISKDALGRICAALATVPEGFATHPKLKGLLASRAALATADPAALALNHADAELIAFGSLLLDSIPVRLSGQDCRRGTFTQRHAVLRDEQTGQRHTPLNALATSPQAALSVWDSPLSEFAVMGFDYGYSRGVPRSLVLWEAQFGDFVNGAQIILDQYLASSEAKWDRWGGLVLLLPHGYEGQGPEHSSARLERFLQLCASDNMEVCYPTTGGQVFHMLRRQALRTIRKPLIVMTPKKFLRELTGSTSEILSGRFQHVMDDPSFAGGKADRSKVATVLLCSGKIYHELAERRAATGRTDTAIVRIEQLYPLHTDALRAINDAYPAAARRIWVQEEPRNQGAYTFIADRLRTDLGIDLAYIGREASASPAVGSLNVHKETQARILGDAIPAAGSAVRTWSPRPVAVARGGAATSNGTPAASEPKGPKPAAGRAPSRAR